MISHHLKYTVYSVESCFAERRSLRRVFSEDVRREIVPRAQRTCGRQITPNVVFCCRVERQSGGGVRTGAFHHVTYFTFRFMLPFIFELLSGGIFNVI